MLESLLKPENKKTVLWGVNQIHVPRAVNKRRQPTILPTIFVNFAGWKLAKINEKKNQRLLQKRLTIK